MNTIFYTDKSHFPSSKEFIEIILEKHFQISNYEILKSESGKPYFSNYEVIDHGNPLYFSIPNTKEKYFIAFSRQNVGIDSELQYRKPDYEAIIAKFDEKERNEITSTTDFLKHWTVKESAIKWLGGTISKDLNKLSFVNGKLLFKGLDLPISLAQFELENHFISVCHEKTSEWKFITV